VEVKVKEGRRCGGRLPSLQKRYNGKDSKRVKALVWGMTDK
jgi:hypothetical protein